MASMWRQAMLYLGLGPDEQYDELDGLQHPDDTPGTPASKSDQVSVVTSPTSVSYTHLTLPTILLV